MMDFASSLTRSMTARCASCLISDMAPVCMELKSSFFKSGMGSKGLAWIETSLEKDDPYAALSKSKSFRATLVAAPSPLMVLVTVLVVFATPSKRDMFLHNCSMVGIKRTS
ncbi:hypothetical protein OXX79_012423 [Metschnikowia pulcherrima]